MDKDIYVIVAENDDGHDPMGPLVFEQYTNTASKEQVEARVKSLNGRFGECRIARLVFDTSAPAPADPVESAWQDFARSRFVSSLTYHTREGFEAGFKAALTQQPASKDGVVIPRSAAEFALSEIRYSATNYYECSPSEADKILSEGKYADADYIAIKQALAQEGEV